MMSAISNSFREEEIIFMDQLLRTIARGGDTNVLVRSPDFATFRGKVARMLMKLEAKKQKERSGA
jgi:hypothetical protein